jgi:dolichyl-phosphate beta-glucosyltransferase
VATAWLVTTLVTTVIVEAEAEHAALDRDTCKTASVSSDEPAPAQPRLPGPATILRQRAPGAVIGLVALVALGFGLAVTSGLWGDPAGRTVFGNVPDAIHYSWWLGHTPHVLGHGGNPFSTVDLNWPQGVSAMNNTTLLLPAVLLFPISWLAGSLTTLNVLNVLAVPACFLAGYWALRSVPWPDAAAGRIGRGAALIGAVTFAISPAVVNSLVGHITMAFAPGLPVLIALSVRVWHGSDSGWVRNGLVLGLVATAQVFTGEEVLFQAVLGAVLVLLVVAVSRPRAVAAAAVRGARTLGVAFAVFLPLTAYPLYLQFLGPLKEKGSPFLPDYFGADTSAFTTPTDRVFLHSAAQAAKTLTYPGGIEEHLAYLGWPLLLTCLIAAVLAWEYLPVRCAAVGLVAAMAFSLGGRLWVHGVWTEHAGPYRLLQKLPVAEASLATRFGLLAALFAAALLAFAVQRVSTAVRYAGNRLPGAVLAAGLAAACLVPLVPKPLEVIAAPAVPAWFTTTARELPKDTVLVVLPYPVAGQPVAMRWQSRAQYRFRMPGGYFLGPDFGGTAFVGGDADPPTAMLLEQVASTGVAIVATPADQAQAMQDFTAWGATQVVLGPDPAQAALRQTVSALLGRQPVLQGGVLVWSTGVNR